MNKKGLYITIEGVEGAGKGTQIKKIEQYFRDNNIDYLMTREPGGSEIGEQIRKILLDTKNKKMDPETEFLLFAANRKQNITEIVKPAKKQGKIIISDRGLDSSVVYQGFSRGVNLDFIKNIHKEIMVDCFPDLTIILLVDPKVGLERVKKDNRAESKIGELDRIEKEGLDFHQKVYDAYKKIAQDDPRYLIVDASQSPEQVFAEIKQVIEKNISTK